MKLSYSLVGQSKSSGTIVFLHGFLEDKSIWLPIAMHYQKLGFQSLLIDLPCHGMSRYDGDHCSMDFMAMEVSGVLNLLHIANPWVIGHSLGGYVGLELLLTQQLQLVLLNSNFWSDPPSKRADRDRIISIVTKAKDIFISEAIPHLFYPPNKPGCQQAINGLIELAKRIPSKEIAACTSGMRDRRSHHELLKTHRVHFIHGENDPILNGELLENELKGINSNVDLHRIWDSGHLAIWEKPVELLAILDSIIIAVK